VAPRIVLFVLDKALCFMKDFFIVKGRPENVSDEKQPSGSQPDSYFSMAEVNLFYLACEIENSFRRLSK